MASAGVTGPTIPAKIWAFTPLTIFVLSLAIKLAIYYLVPDHALFMKYPFFAERIGQGVDIGERILDVSPFYLYLSILFYKICGSNWDLLAIFQIFAGSLNCLIVYVIGARIFGVAAGVLAAAMLMLYGNLTLIELTLEPEVFVLLFNSLAILALLKAADAVPSGYRSWRWLLAGAVIGLSAVTKANALLLLPGAFIWMLISVKPLSQRTAASILLLLGALLLILPVTLRNYILFHDQVLITADGGKVFFHGNGPGASGMERADLDGQFAIEERADEPDYAHVLFRKTARMSSNAQLKPSACSAFWFAAAAKHVIAHPLDVFLLEVKKFTLFWHSYEVHDYDSTYRNYVELRNWPLLTMGIIAPLGILGMAMSLKRFRDAFLLYWMVFMALFSVLLFFCASRYRLPNIPFLIIFAAQFLLNISLWLKQNDVKKTVGSLLFVLLLLVGTYLPFKAEIEAYDHWQQVSRIHYSLGGKKLFESQRYQEAIQKLEAVVAMAPYFEMPYSYLGKSYAALGDYAKAESCLKKFVWLSPGIDEGHLDLGILQFLKGDPVKAKPHLEQALALNPDNAKAKKYLEALRQLSS